MKKINWGCTHKTPKVPAQSHRSTKAGPIARGHTHGPSSKKSK